MTDEGNKLFEILRKLRTSISNDTGIIPGRIFADVSLIDMCIKLPVSNYEFMNIEKVNNSKINKYGMSFISEIQKFKSSFPNAITYKEENT